MLSVEEMIESMVSRNTTWYFTSEQFGILLRCLDDNIMLFSNIHLEILPGGYLPTGYVLSNGITISKCDSKFFKADFELVKPTYSKQNEYAYSGITVDEAKELLTVAVKQKIEPVNLNDLNNK